MPVICTNTALENSAFTLSGNAFTAASIYGGSAGAPGFPPQNMFDEATYNSWLPADAGVDVVGLDMGSARAIRSFGIAAHNMASQGGSIALQGSADASSWTTIVGPYAALTNEEILFIFPQVSYRYYRIVQSGAKYNIGYAAAGVGLSFPCTPIDSYTPTNHSKRYTKMFNNSVSGHLLGNRVLAAGGNTSVSFPLLQRDWVDGPLTGFEYNYNIGRTFFYAGWPKGKPQDVAYAWAGSSESIIEVEYVQAEKLASVSFDMEFYVGS